MNIRQFSVVILLLAAMQVASANALVESSTSSPIASRYCSPNLLGYASTKLPTSSNEDLRQASPLQSHADEQVPRYSRAQADIFVNRYCKLVRGQASRDDRMEAAALAIESTLDAHRTTLAAQVANEESINHALDPSTPLSPSTQRLQLALARLQANKNELQRSAQLRRQLQPALSTTFGLWSDESIANQVRLASLEAQMGNTNGALEILNPIDEGSDLGLVRGIRNLTMLRETKADIYAIAGEESRAIDALSKMNEALEQGGPSAEDERIRVLRKTAEMLASLGRLEEALEKASQAVLARKIYGNFLDYDDYRCLILLTYIYIESGRYESAKTLDSFLLERLHSQRDAIQEKLNVQALSLSAELDSIERDREDEIQKRFYVLDFLGKTSGWKSPDARIERANLAFALLRYGDVQAGCEQLASLFQSAKENETEASLSLEFARNAYLYCTLQESDQESATEILGKMRRSSQLLARRGGAASINALRALASYARAALIAKQPDLAKRSLATFVQVVEEASENSTSGSVQRTSLFSQLVKATDDWRSPVVSYNDYALLLAEDHDLDAAVRVSELGRDREIGDRFLEDPASGGLERLPDPRNLAAVANSIQRLDEAIAASTDVLAIVKSEAERTLLLARKFEAETEIRLRDPNSTRRSAPASAAEIQTAASENTILVSLLRTSDGWFGLIVGKGAGVRSFRIECRDFGSLAKWWADSVLGRPVRVWRLTDGRFVASIARPSSAAGAPMTNRDLGASVATCLLGSLLPYVGESVERLVFIPDDTLVGVPLHALPLDDGTLLDRFEISYAPSLTTFTRWQGARGRREHAKDLLAIGAVDEGIDSGAPRPPADDDPIFAGWAYAKSHPLPFAKAEVEDIAALFPAARVAVWTGPRASKERLRRASESGELRDYRVVHFATHAWGRADRPESSAIVLGAASAALPSDAVLTSAELAGLHMGSDLIVLSACETGVGRYEHGRGLLGLAYASLAAGNRAALLSLWPVADDTTAEFMRAFYARLRQGLAPPAALTSTQREFRRSADPRLADPLVWAAFVLYGGY